LKKGKKKNGIIRKHFGERNSIAKKAPKNQIGFQNMLNLLSNK